MSVTTDRKVDSKTLYIDGNTGRVVHHEYDEHGSHRLVLESSLGTNPVAGEWTHYTGVATVTSSDGQDSYMGMSEYSGERVLTTVPCEKVSD